MKQIARCLLLTALVLSPAAGQEEGDLAARLTPAESTPITVGERVVFRSEILATDVSMGIKVPESFAVSSADHTYPVVFVNGSHGRRFFTTVAGIVTHLGDRERMPEAIVVSLDSMGGIPEIHTNGMWSAETLGGTPNPELYLRHLDEEVFPYLETKYRANHYRLIVGVSGSSLFPIHTFTAAPELFDSHILIAAADMIGMGYEPGKTFIDAFAAALEKSPKRQAKLYVGVAEDDLEKRDDYRQNLRTLSERLRLFEGLDLETEIFPDTDHYEVLVQGLMSALDQNFPKARWSSRYRDLVAQPGDALENIDRYYAELSTEYGFTILPRADRWNSVNCLRFMTRHLIREGRVPEALAVAERRVEYQPGSPGSFTGLADALEAADRLDTAIEAQKKAIVLASDDAKKRLEERLRDLEEKALGEG